MCMCGYGSWTTFVVELALLPLVLKAGTHQADGRPLANVGLSASDGWASLFGVLHSSALVGLTSAAVCPIQHVELASGLSAKGRTLIGGSV